MPHQVFFSILSHDTAPGGQQQAGDTKAAGRAPSLRGQRRPAPLDTAKVTGRSTRTDTPISRSFLPHAQLSLYFCTTLLAHRNDMRWQEGECYSKGCLSWSRSKAGRNSVTRSPAGQRCIGTVLSRVWLWQPLADTTTCSSCCCKTALGETST